MLIAVSAGNAFQWWPRASTIETDVDTLPPLIGNSNCRRDRNGCRAEQELVSPLGARDDPCNRVSAVMDRRSGDGRGSIQ
jgi:hypothetical protein